VLASRPRFFVLTYDYHVSEAGGYGLTMNNACMCLGETIRARIVDRAIRML
jgi:hypothetical protein